VLKKVLMIAYHYPPEGGSSGVLRALKFSKFLPANGWLPHILTLRESFYPVRDEALLQDVPTEAVVHRTLAFDNARHLAIKGRHLAFLGVPDRFVSWFLFGVAKGLRVIRNQSVEAIYSTSPPATAHLIGAALKSITSAFWVADFRDPWIEEGSFPVPGTFRYRIESALERMVMRQCDCVLVTTPYLKQEFLSRYPELPKDKIQVIYNGYDESDFSHNGVAPSRNQFEIIHAGLVTREFRNPLPLLETMASLIAEGSLPRNQLKITFMGGDWWVASPEFAAEVKRLGLHEVVIVEGRVSHKEALERLAQAAVLLLLQASDDTRSLIPAKAFEYLRVGRPILALTIEGATADLLKGRNHSFVVDPGDSVGLRNSVLSLYDLWRKGGDRLEVDAATQQYERSKLTAQLAKILDRLTTQTVCGKPADSRAEIAKYD
jgi:glycosyltransferase involved in cell wall biosynthesis